jgi:hypothetical protein
MFLPDSFRARHGGRSAASILVACSRAPQRCLLAVLVAAACLGCGRKATVEDCEQIVRRIAELELQGMVPQEELNAQVKQAEQTFRERALADCVGRRITERSLACVAAAKTPEAVIDDCFD